VLKSTDKISIVTYAGNTSVRLAPTPISEEKTIWAVIQGLESGGSTNGAGGLQLAYEQAKQGYIEGGLNHVLLCTDGDFNVGLSDNTELVKFIEEKRKTGITLTVLGFGTGNLNDSMMEAITNAGNGVYSVISDADQALKYVHTRLLSVMNYVAKDVKIQVEFNPAQVYAYRLLGYENRAIADDDFRVDTVDAGEVGSGHTVTALYELVLSSAELPRPEGAPALVEGVTSDKAPRSEGSELCRVYLRYKDVHATEQDEAREMWSGIMIDGIHAEAAQAGTDFLWANAIAAFSEILKESPFARPDRLNTIAQMIADAAGTDGDRLEFKDLLARARVLLGK
jgi:Ca-activated chloride channel homolog